ncbi:unnamed protein product [Linum tenue]|uniref:Uncharacterized protein n=1 Tax=Linum tenue TaxID=586396 RepID=A0AAV0KPY3_9ROSI|nr:unnamed protein product [Linum tenue]
MRGALSSLLEWPRWLGSCLLKFLSAIFLLSLQNQSKLRSGASGDLLLSDTGNGNVRYWTRFPTRTRRALCKRKRVQECDEPNSSSVLTLSNPRPVQKRRIVRCYEWRFWLPSSLDLVGDSSMLSVIDDFKKDVSIPAGKAVDIFDQGDRDFVAEAMEVRNLKIPRSRRRSPVPSARKSTVEFPGRAAGDAPPKFWGLGIDGYWTRSSDFVPPVSAGLGVCYQYIPSLRYILYRDPNLTGNSIPTRPPSLPIPVNPNQESKGGLGTLFKHLSPRLLDTTICQTRNREKPAAVGSSSFFPSLENCSDDGADLPLGGSRRSVWINQQNLNNIVTGRSESSSGHRGRNQPPARTSHLAPSNASMGSVSQEEPSSHRGKRIGRSPARRGSPGGIVLNRHPKLRLGGPRQKQRENKKGRAANGLREAENMVSSQEYVPMGDDSLQDLGGDHDDLIHAATRRRRLILEKDSDDDIVDATHASAENVQLTTKDGSLLNPGKGPVPTVTGDGAGKGHVPTVTGSGAPAKRKPRRPKTHPPVQAGERAAPRADEARVEAPSLLADIAPLPSQVVPSVGSASAVSSLAAGEGTLAKRKPRKVKAPMVCSVDEGAVPSAKAAEALGLNQPGPARGKRKLRKAHLPAGEEKKEPGPLSNGVLQGEEPTCEPKMSVGGGAEPVLFVPVVWRSVEERNMESSGSGAREDLPHCFVSVTTGQIPMSTGFKS